ncbi:MAG: rhodanese-like domain-containing protein [Oscillatoriales cyanobacterium C42_A2020_001]|nr:rhodanese-like domain-containing protein [Leptolyngbyaceae cyanobacterium C42_A2020_001]
MNQKLPSPQIQQSVFAFCDGLLTAVGFNPPPQSPIARQQRIEEMYEHYARQFPTVEAISVEQLQQLQQAQPVALIDVRSPQEQAVSIMPGAITTAAFERDRDRYANHIPVAYCTIGHRSGLYAQKHQQQGVKILNLRGSVLAWTHAGGNFITSDGKPTHRVHVYSPRWNLVAPGYESVW